MREDDDKAGIRIRTTCSRDCPDRCSVLARPGARDLDLRGDPDHPFTRGFLCRKIRRHPGRLTSPDRIVHPWVRTEGRTGPFRPASWDEAMAMSATAIARARDDDPASVLMVRSAGAMGASKGLIDLVFASLGARTPVGSLCDVAGTEAIRTDAGDLRMNDPAQIGKAETVVLWGKNPRASSVHNAAQVVEARRRGARVVAITPDASSVRGLADHVVSIRPGRDRFLALAVAGLLLGRTSPPWTLSTGREAFEALVTSAGFDVLLDASGVSEADARIVADSYGAGPRVATIVGWGVQRYREGGETVRALHALAFLAGSLGAEGGGFYFSAPGSRFLKPVTHLLRGAEIPPTPTPPLRLPTLARDMMHATPPIRVAWLTSTNIVNQGADSAALRRAFEAVETVVAVESFWTETARSATVVLPPALWLEEEDVIGSMWRNELAAVRRVVDPPAGCRTDFHIALELAERLGLDVPCDSLDGWLGLRLPGGERQLAEIRGAGWVDVDVDPIAWRDGFAHTDGRFRLLSHLTPPADPDPERPLHLLTLVRGEATHSQISREEQAGPLAVRLHPTTAATLGIEQGRTVRVVGESGEFRGVLRLDEGLHETAVACPRGGWVEYGQGVNLATEATPTDLGDGTAYYSTTVRLEPV